MTGFYKLIENHKDTTSGDSFNTAYKMWSGMEMMAQFKICGIRQDNIETLGVGERARFTVQQEIYPLSVLFFL